MKAKQQIRQAIDTLYTHGQPTHEAYTHLVLECFRSSNFDQAKRLQSHMELTHFEPNDAFIYNRLLHIYAKSGKLLYARYLFDKMPKRDVFSWNAMLSLYAKSSFVKDLREVFDKMPVRDSVSYNTVIKGLTVNGFSSEALEIFMLMQRKGFEPTDYTHVSALQACSQLLDLNRGKQIHGRIVVNNTGQNAFLSNALTDLYAKCGEMDMAKWLFDKMVNKTVVSWNLMIDGFLKNQKPDKSISLFSEMQSEGVKPDQVTLSNVVGAYIQIGQMNEAANILDAIKEKDKVCWTTMIVGYVQNGKEEDALMLFNKMLMENVKPDSYTMSSVVSSCAKLASLHHGQALHGKSFRMGCDDHLLVSTALVNLYCSCGATNSAWCIFSEIKTKSVVSWNSMIRGCTQNGQDIEALALYEEMLNENLKPDNFTFVSVLSACSRAGLIEKGKSYFGSITKQHGLTPTVDHYACMINLVCHSGCTDKAVNLIKSMPHEPNSVIWSTLLSVCAKKGDIENGEMAAKQLFELEPSYAGPYIMLSNIYAKHGRWKDVANIRSVMKSKNVKKFAAFSWVEIDNKIFKFVSDDRTHPETERIFKELDRLIKRLKEESGYALNTNLVLHDVVEEEKLESISYHSEKLALAFWLIKKPYGSTPIRIMKNIRVCPDCHLFMKFASNVTGRQIILRDFNRFHHFINGNCSCKDCW